MKRVIVTGGTGFIGRHLIKKLLSSKSYYVILLSNESHINDKYLARMNMREDNTPLRFYTVDIRNRKALSEILVDEKADTCIHLAAKISVSDSIKNPKETMEINIDGTLNVLEACYKSKIKNFLFASSAAVYGDVLELPIKENATLRPLSPYGSSKMLAERHVLSYENLKKIENAIMLRIFNVYGPGQTSEADVISKFVARLSKGLPPIIYGNGTQTRDFISVDDVADAIMKSIELMDNGYESKSSIASPAFNVGSGKPTSINEIANKMIGISGVELEPVYVEETEDNKSILHSFADVTKAKNILHFVPKKDIDTGLNEIIQPNLIRR